VRNKLRVLDTRLTIEEVAPNHSTIGETPVVDWFALSDDAIPKRCKITNCRARAHVLQELPNGSLLAPLSKFKKHFRTLVRVGKEFVLVLFVELSSDGVVDLSNNGTMEECIFLN